MADGPTRDWLIDSVLDDIRLCFHRLKAAAERLHQRGEPSAAQRSVLRSLDHGGPQTVPEMARSRPVSRQHIQTVVNALLEDGFVEVTPNPAHRRSHLVRLTADGEREVGEMATRETALLRELNLAVTDADLETAHRVLSQLRDALGEEALDAAMERARRFPEERDAM